MVDGAHHVVVVVQGLVGGRPQHPLHRPASEQTREEPGEWNSD